MIFRYVFAAAVAYGRNRRLRKGGEQLFERKDVAMQPSCARIRLEAMLRYLPGNHGINIAEYGYAENVARERLLLVWAEDVESPSLSMGPCLQISPPVHSHIGIVLRPVHRTVPVIQNCQD